MGTTSPRRGFWIRLAAGLIDYLCTQVFYLATAWTAYAAAPPANVSERLYAAIHMATILLCLAFDVFTAATPGKAILRLCVGNSDGTPAAVATRFLRFLTKSSAWWIFLVFVFTENNAIYVIGGISLFLVAVGCLPVLNESRQAWHDQVAGTAVFRRADVYGPKATPRGFPLEPPSAT